MTTRALAPVPRSASPVPRYVEGIGRRKRAVARVRLVPGTGAMTINGRPWEEYFPVVSLQTPVRGPLVAAGKEKAFDVSVHVRGGGVHAQAGAVRLGMARALLAIDEALRGTLRGAGHLTRDPREKERKKPGLKRARRAPQWAKR